MSRNALFTAFLLAFLFGILLFEQVQDILLSLLVFLFLCVFFWVASILYRPIYLTAILLLSGFALGNIYGSYDRLELQKNLSFLAVYEQQSIDAQGYVKEVYRRSDFTDQYMIQLLKIGKNEVPEGIYHILEVPKNFHVEVGDTLKYSGRLSFFEDFDGFSYQDFMLSQDLYFRINVSKADVISKDTENLFVLLWKFRSSLLEKIEALYPPEEALFLGGILFWARENLPADLKEDFNNSGLTHFIAVSGFNITLCILFVSAVFGFFPLWFRSIAVTLVIISFSLFVGLGAPVVRAAIMGILGYLFLQQGSTLKHITLLAFTACCMTLYSPLSLSYDVSMHLSFLAVIGIIYTQAYFKKLFFWVPKSFAIQEACILTFSALSFSLALMMFQFGQVSLLAPLANIAVTWTIPLAMLLWSISILANMLSSFLGEFFAFITWMLLHYDIMMVRFFGNLEFALWQIEVGVYKNYLQMLYFILLIYILSYLHLRNKKQPF